MNAPRLTEESVRYAREGRIIEGGWASLRNAVVSPHAPPAQLREMRMAFFAGAQYLYASLMRMMDAGDEPTHADLALMRAIDDELTSFAQDFAARQAHDAATSAPAAAPQPAEPHPLDDWHEGLGDVLWWRFPVDEAPYVRSPLDENWPGYHTHWTPLPPIPGDPTGGARNG